MIAGVSAVRHELPVPGALLQSKQRENRAQASPPRRHGFAERCRQMPRASTTASAPDAGIR